MATKQSTYRLTERSQQQLSDLAERFGDKTKALTIAVDRAHRNEFKQFKVLHEYRHCRDAVAGMSEQELDHVADALHVRRMEIMAARLEAAGFKTLVRPRLQVPDPDPVCDLAFNLILVFAPPGCDADTYNEWSDLSEARRLLDTAHNLPPAEAFARWRTKIRPLAREPYTAADASRDVRREREELRLQLDAGEIDTETFSLAWKHAGDLLSFVEK
jgi:hypothetical protein